ncbi:MAG: glycosyltransferase [Erythrobacter sp.]|nr:MAG: glycosyltransferase [Erythrobacter sp.]
MHLPAISVAMSVYNGEAFLADAIESVLAQNFDDFEFLLLDDGSRDGSTDIIRAYAARDARIRPIIRENRGLIASLNQLIAESRAPLIARMDDDDISQPQRFERQVAFLAEHSDYGVVGSWSEDIDIEGRPIFVTGTDHPLTHEDVLHTIDARGQVLCHPSVMYRREVVQAVGGYHAAFRHCEDLDLWLRLASRTKLGNIPERLVKYRRSPDQVSNRHATEQQIGTAVAFFAYAERKAGRPDPTADLDALPPLDSLDALFGRAGVAAEVRRHLANSLQYSPDAMRDHGFDLLLRHLRESGDSTGMWRTVLRLLRFGEPGRALRLLGNLVAAR